MMTIWDGQIRIGMPVELRGGRTGNIGWIGYAYTDLPYQQGPFFLLEDEGVYYSRLHIQPYGTQELVRGWKPKRKMRVVYSSSVRVVS